jgi:signal transduction histidine kinase
MTTRTGQPRNQSSALFVAASLVIVAIVGTVDYLTGYDIFFSTFYLLAVALAAWKVGPWFAVFVSALSVASWIGGDLAAGAKYPSLFVPFWNACITFAFYIVVVWLLTRLRSMQNELEERVRRRTASLRDEMAERQRLEGEILEISENERRAIGRDLHDSLGQHLTGAALAGQVLEEKLAAKSLAETGDARHLVGLIEEAIELTRQLARGLHPVEMQADGLMNGLRDLAAITTDRFKVPCSFACEPPVLIDDSTVSSHLYRIAQEAVTNAVKHSNAKNISLALIRTGNGIRLTIEDDGVGVPDPLPRTDGMGLRILAHRANIISGTFDISRRESGGTKVSCDVP